MSDLENSNKRLIQGVVRLIRNEVSGWEQNSEYDVPNVWGKSVPDSARQEFPRGVADVIAGSDFELSVDLGIRLREVSLQFTIFAESDGPLETLMDDVESTIDNKWNTDDPNGDPYLGDWSFREMDDMGQTNESNGSEGNLRYSRSKEFIFETIRHN